MPKINMRKTSSIIIPAIIGLITFLIIYGINPLKVSNVNWILLGYDESDIIQHYSGWLAYRNSEWAFPLGLANDMAVGDGTYITYTDSIPLVAILLKVFRSFLPAAFQYFGLYTLLCFILQSIAAFKIVYLKTQNYIYSSIATILFTFAPVLVERAFRHTALGSQWLILFALYLYLEYRDKKSIKTWVCFLLLEILSIGIHPYFLPLVAVFEFLCLVEDIKLRKWISIIYIVVIQAVTFLFGFIIGALANDVSPSRWGYGYFSMNLNAPINPYSIGAYEWSKLFTTHSQTLGNYDGFSYLGAGILAFMIVDLSLLIYTGEIKLLLKMIKDHALLIVMCVLLTLFAITNVITLDDQILYELKLPEKITGICAIFRASSRMFYPVYYLIFVSLIVVLWRITSNGKKYTAFIILALIVALQIYDISGCISQKHKYMNDSFSVSTLLDDPVLTSIASQNSYLLADDFQENYIPITAWAYTNHMKTYFSIGSGNFEESRSASDEILNRVKTTGDIGDNVIITTNFELAQQYDEYENIAVYATGNWYYIYNVCH
ncbi:MAG: DUF6311 domain-containing protein [Saccharofermentans sp.]|nr:DUF6311 domain-containing protein [Saccharofermentans sp.]